MITGVWLTVKLINYLLKNYKDVTYNFIFGFSISTVVLMGIKCLNSNYTLVSLIVAFIVLLLGIFISKKINHYITND